MKAKIALLTAALLLMSCLAGCGAKEAPAAAETTQALETQALVVETTAPAVPETEAPTEAPTQAPTEAPFEVSITPVITEEQTQVTVTTTDEFLAAIAPNTEILVDAEIIDLSLATGYGKTGGQYYHWQDEYDGPGLYITGVSNLTIRGTGEDHNANLISSDPRYAYVLTFENCANIWVKGFTAGHSKEPGACMGGVLGFRNCQDILVEDCGLFGCGTLGVLGEQSKNMQIVNNEIYECSVGGVEFSSCKDINVDGNSFRDLGQYLYDDTYMEGSVFRIYDCENITYNGKDAPAFCTVEELEGY